MNIYVAASWRTPEQPHVVALLRHHFRPATVYDFRDHGFGWDQVDGAWQAWSMATYRQHLLTDSAIAQGFQRDKDALVACDVCVLVLPCGRSAHLELGWALGQGKTGIVYCPPWVTVEPDLMYLLADALVLSEEELLQAVSEWEPAGTDF